MPLGAGGLTTGFDIAPDGTMVCRTDVGNCYRWSATATIANADDAGQHWIPLLTRASMGASFYGVGSIGGWELKIAPSDSTIMYGVFTANHGDASSNYVYRSADSGATWTKTNLGFENADGNTTSTKNVQQKIAIDPNNPNVVYAGMPNSSGKSFAIYRALDGLTFNSIDSLGAVALAPGCGGLQFDPKSATVVVDLGAGNQTVTSRLLLPVGGVGIWETVDGGVTFNEIAVTAMGSSTIAVTRCSMDFDSVYYCVVTTNSVNGFVWRYEPAGNWVRLDLAINGWIGATTGYAGVGGTICADPRSGHQGYLNVTGGNGMGIGYTSTNANLGTAFNPGSPTSIVWGGGTGGELVTLQTGIPAEPQWFNFLQAPLNGFIGAWGMIDKNGVFWWCGTRSFWRFTAIPNWAISTATTSKSMARGIESTVSQDVCCPPGATYPVLAAQDVGVQTGGTFVSFPTNNFYSGVNINTTFGFNSARPNAQSLAYSANDPAFMVCRNCVTSNNLPLNGYSTDYGINWNLYAVQPDTLYFAQVTGFIDDGSAFPSYSGIPGKVLTITNVASGVVQITQGIGTTLGSSAKGTITSLTTGIGGTGTYGIDTSSATPSATLYLASAIQGGACAAVDSTHHIHVPSGFAGSYFPVSTADGGASWNFCVGLPSVSWTSRSHVFGQNAKPFAVGYGADLGNVYAMAVSAGGLATIYVSIDSGANFSVHSTQTISTGGFHGGSIFTVPGYPGELWISSYYTSAAGAGIWHWTDTSGVWTKLTWPASLAGGYFPIMMCLGPPQIPGNYPTLYCMVWKGSATANGGLMQSVIYYSQNTGATWSILGSTGTPADYAPNATIADLVGLLTIQADWNQYGRLLACANQCGFLYYNP